MSHVLGFEPLNEPTVGFIGLKLDGSNVNLNELIGYAFTPINAILTGAGFTQTVPFKEVKGLGIKETRHDEINPKKISCWIDGVEDVWKKEGVWSLDKHNEPKIIDNDYFIQRKGKIVNFFLDYLSPFINKFSKELRSINSDTIIFYEGPAETMLKGEEVELVLPNNAVSAPHWYDVATLSLNRFMDIFSYDILESKILFGRKAIKKAFHRQMATLKTIADKCSTGSPTIIGEFGLPYNINKKKAYKVFREKSKESWTKHIKALCWYYDTLDANLLNSCQWNYNPENNNKWGDLWNLEDFSIFSRDQQTVDWTEDINSGGRGIPGFCRPHFISVAGEPLKMEFNIKKGIFLFEFNGDTSIEAPTTIYVPKIQYPTGFNIEVTEGEIKKEKEQIVSIKIHKNNLHIVKISKK
jgi:hypothetical protein